MGVGSYRVHQRTGTGLWSHVGTTTVTGTTTGTTFTAAGLKRNTAYDFAVTAVDTSGNASGESAVLKTKTLR